ncbi:MAG: trehalose-phosphatase, partial [Planctomyces sp.]
MHEYTHHIERLAAASVLLVGCDFDGTISALTSPPSAARPLASAVEVLEEIASLPTTHSAVISGRPLAELRERLQSDSTDARSRIRHVGSHGAEYDDSPTVPLAGTWLSLLD